MLISRAPAVLAVLMLAALLAWLLPFRHPAPAPPEAVPTGGDFTLHSAQGPVRLSDFRGKVVLLYFGYAACPDICPTNLAMLALALRTLSDTERAAVQTLFVSVDPERDDPERLRQYVGYFHPEILGLTGTPRHIAAVAARYGVAYRRAPEESALGYLVDHSAYTYLIDRQGRLRETLDHATASERIVKRVRHYLAEAVPTDAGAAPDATIPR